MRLWLADFDVARDHFTRALRLSPLDRELYSFQTGLAWALALGEHAEPEQGLDLAQKALVAKRNWRPALHVQICCLVMLGRLDEAKEMAQQELALWPNFTLSAWRPRLPQRARIMDTIFGLLRQAGSPE